MYLLLRGPEFEAFTLSAFGEQKRRFAFKNKLLVYYLIKCFLFLEM